MVRLVAAVRFSKSGSTERRGLPVQNAPTPQISRPTISSWIVSVPS